MTTASKCEECGKPTDGGLFCDDCDGEDGPATCPVCGEESSGGWVHKECMVGPDFAPLTGLPD